MRVLCTCWPALGHFHVMVPLARALASAGHEVAFATAAAFGPYVRQVGFEVFPAGPSEAVLDLAMLVVPGGEERTEDEYRILLEKSGFRLTRVIPTRTSACIIEAIPV